MMLLPIFATLVGFASALQPLPPVQWTNRSIAGPGFVLQNAPQKIYLARAFSNVRDTAGLTLIPPSAYEFAETFRADLSSIFNANWTLEQVDELPSAGIVLGSFRGNASEITYENGVKTEEGYEIEVTNGRVFVGGTGARGMFWGTRTLLQELSISSGSLASGRTTDTPAYATRGYLVSWCRLLHSLQMNKLGNISA